MKLCYAEYLPHNGAHPGYLVLDGLLAADDPADGLLAAVRVVVEGGGGGMEATSRQGAARGPSRVLFQLL